MAGSERPSPRPVPPPARTRIVPLDGFVMLNIALFVLMCVFTYYARFVRYRGSANVWEFFVYAAVLLAGIGLLWRYLRGYALPTSLLSLIQAGILAHFAGAFVQWDGHRLYDYVVAGIRYDKFVHFTNAFIAVRVAAHVTERHGLRLDGLTRLLIGLSVLGLGAIVEIVEYVVVRTVPGNGVGGYDNNMQDLAANLAGTLASVLTAREARTLRLHEATRAVPARRVIAWRQERTFSLVEIVGMTAAVWFAIWTLPALLPPRPFAIAAVVLLTAGLLYTVWLSPVLVHGDRLEARGLGPARDWFIRRDNLRDALRAFGLLALAGTIALLLLAEWQNPGWLGRANWRSWVVRLVFYAASAYVQALVFVGFLLVRLTRLIGASGERSIDDAAGTRVLISGLAATIFATLHAPGLMVMGMTGVFGFAAAFISLRTPNVFATALCHALLGLLVHRGLELPLRVGYFYSHPGSYVFREAFPWVREIVGGLW